MLPTMPLEQHIDHVSCHLHFHLRPWYYSFLIQIAQLAHSMLMIPQKHAFQVLPSPILSLPIFPHPNLQRPIHLPLCLKLLYFNYCILRWSLNRYMRIILSLAVLCSWDNPCLHRWMPSGHLLPNRWLFPRVRDHMLPESLCTSCFESMWKCLTLSEYSSCILWRW